MSPDSAVRGAKSAAPGLVGGMVLGPVIGAPVAGFAWDKTMGDRSAGSRATEAGVAIGLAGLLLGAGQSNPFAAPDAQRRRGFK